MTDAVIISLIGLSATCVTAVLQTYVALNQSKQGKDMKELAKNTNSIKDALVAKTAQASHAEGKLEGISEEQARK